MELKFPENVRKFGYTSQGVKRTNLEAIGTLHLSSLYLKLD